MRLAYHQVRQSEIQPLFIGLVTRVHNPHMGNKVPRQIKAGQMDTPLISLQCRKDSICQTLGGFPSSITGEHAVDIRIVQGPETLTHVHGKLPGTGNHQYAAVR